jgi:hypothetical protein
VFFRNEHLKKIKIFSDNIINTKTMKRKKILFQFFMLMIAVLMLIPSKSSCKNIQDENDWKIFGLVGQVKSLKEYSFKTVENINSRILDKVIYFNEKGKMTEERRYNSEGEISNWEVYKYDDKGNLIENIRFKSNRTLRSREIYTYNPEGNLIEKVFYYDDDWVAWRDTYTYDSEGNLIMNESLDSNETYSRKYIYEYGPKGKLKKMNMLSLDGQIFATRLYDENEKLIEDIDTREGGQRTTFHYNNIEQLVEINNYFTNRYNIDIHNKEIRKYDQTGNLIEEKQDSQDDRLKYERSYKYKYDGKNNWIKREMSNNGNHTNTVDRVIEYF